MRYQKAVKSTLTITILAIIAGILGFFQQMAIAYVFGAGETVDAFVAARTVPDIFTKILQVGILSIIFVPIFVKCLHQKEEKKAWDIAVNLFNIITTFFICAVALGMALTPWIVKVMVPGFDLATKQLTVKLALILFPAIIFNILTILGTSILHAFKKFTMPALIKLILPLTIILSLLIFGRRFGIYILSFAFLLVAILEFLTIFSALYKQGLRYKFSFRWRDPMIKKMIILVYPFIFSTILAQTSTVVNRMLASTLSAGSLSALYYAERVMKFVSQIFLFAIPIVSFPTFAEKIARGEYKELVRAVRLVIRVILFMIIPTSIGIIILRLPIVKILFQRGEFDLKDTQATAFALLFFMFGLFATGITNVLANIFYGLEKTKILVKITIVVITLNIGLNFLLVRYLNHGGLALATSLTNIFSLVIHGIILSKYLPMLKSVLFDKYYLKILIPSIVMGLFVFFSQSLIYFYLPNTQITNQVINLALIIIPSILIYLVSAYLIKLEETELVLNTIRSKIRK